MASISQVTQAVFQGRYDDQISAAAGAATAALERNAAAVETVDTAVTRATKSATALVNANDALTQKTNALIRATAQLAAAQDELAAGVASGKISVDQQAGALAGLSAKVQKARDDLQALQRANAAANDTSNRGAASVAASSASTVAASTAAAGALKLQSYQWTNLSYQLQDFVVQVGSGGGIFRPLLQQAPQAVDAVGGVSNAMTLLGQGFSAITSPIGLAITAVVAVSAALVGSLGAFESSQRQLKDLQNQLRATRDDYVSLASAVKAAGTDLALNSVFSRSQSIGAIASVAGTQEFGGTTAQLRQLGVVLGDVATLMGGDLPKAAASMAQAFHDPAAVAKQFADSGMFGFTQSLADNARRLQETGDKGAATNLVYHQLAEASAGATRNHTQMQNGLTDLANEFGKLWETIRPVVDGLGSIASFTLRNTITGVRTDIAQLNGPALPDQATRDTRLDDALSAARQNPGRAAEIARIRRQSTQLRDALPLATSPEDRTTIRSSLGALGQQAYGLRGPEAQFMDGLKDQTAVASAEAGAERELAQARVALDRATQSAGQGQASDNAQRAVAAEVTRRLTAEYGINQVALTNQIHQQELLGAAIRAGAELGRLAEASILAQDAATKTSIRDTPEWQHQVELLTTSYRNLAQVRADVAGDRAVQDQDRQIAYFRAETAAVGGTADARGRDLAALKATQEAEKAGYSPEVTQRYVDRAIQISDATRELQRQQSALQALGDIGQQAFDRIGQNITEAFTNGSLKAITFGSVMKGVISEVAQGFIKLAILNPIKNAFLGGTNATLGSVLGLFGGGSAASAAVAGTYTTADGQTVGYNSTDALPAGATIVSQAQAARPPGAATTGGTSLASVVGSVGSLGGSLGIFPKLFGGADSLTGASGLLNYVFGAPSSGAASYNLGSLGNVFRPGGQVATGFGGVDSVLNTSLYEGVGSTAVTAGNAIAGGAGILGGAYGIASGIAKGGIGGAVTAAGGGLGVATGALALAGLSLGPVGAIAAAVLSLIGAFLPGQKPSNRTGSSQIDFDTGENISFGQTGAKYSQANRDEATGIGGNILQLGSTIGAALGTRPRGQIIVDVGSRDGLGLAFAGQGDVNRTTQKFKYDDDGVKQLTKAVVVHLIEEMRLTAPEAVARAIGGVDFNADTDTQLGTISKIGTLFNNGQPSASQTVASRNVNWSNFDAASADLTWVRDVYDQMGSPAGQAAASKFGQSLKAINEQWQPLIDQASRLGLAFDGLQSNMQNAIGKATDARNLQVVGLEYGITAREQSLQGLGLSSSLTTYDIQSKNEAASLQQSLADLGLSTAEVADQMNRLAAVQVGERQAIVDNYEATKASTDAQNAATAAAKQNAINSTARGLLESLAIGDAGGLAPETRYFAGLSSLNAARQAIQPGDVDSVQEYVRVASLVLPVAKDFLGVSGRYSSLVSDVSSTLNTVAPGAGGNLAQIIAAATSGQDNLSITFAQYGDQQIAIGNATLAEMRRLSGLIEAIIRRAA